MIQFCKLLFNELFPLLVKNVVTMEVAHNETQNDKEVIKIQFRITYTVLSLEDRTKHIWMMQKFMPSWI